MPIRRQQPIASWKAGETVQGFALLARKETREDRNGRSYLDMELSDSSGSIVAKVWGDSPALTGAYEAHDFVAFRGSVKLYRDALQMSVDECRKATDADREYGFDEALLIPSTREDIDDLWRRMLGIYREQVRRPVMRQLFERGLERHGGALREHPAAKAMHHAYRGGLLEHVVSMAELAIQVTSHYTYLDRDLILLGIFFHDLGKIRELGAMPVNDYTVEGRLVGHVVIGRDLLLECARDIPDFPADLRIQLEHLVLSHQGRKEYSAAVEPMTAEALVLHFIDDLDAKLNQLQVALQRGSGMQFMKGLGRYIYLDGLTETPLPEESPQTGQRPAPEEGAAPEEGEADPVAPTPEPPQPRLF